jgi:F-type H+-transporting ATPase subunit b
MIKLLLITALSFSVASASSGGETDILQRSVNFTIFAFIIYYLLADKIKFYFTSRKSTIQDSLQNAQDALKASKKRLDEAESKIIEAKRLAGEIIDGAHKEAETLENKIDSEVEQEISKITAQFEERKAIETKKAKREIVKEFLTDVVKDDNTISKDDLVDLVLRKVA